MQVFITGIGVDSAIGIGAEANLQSLRSGISGIRKSVEFNVMLGEVCLSNEDLFTSLQLPREDFSRTSLLALLAAQEAWGKNQHDDRIRTGMVSSTSLGGLDRTEKYYFQAQKEGTAATYHLMTHEMGRTTERVAKALGFSGFIETISTACSSGANAIMHGARLINGDLLDRVLVGGSDPLTVFNINGFSSLMISDKEMCRPFDASRKGMNMGEGAGFLVLENERSLAHTGNTPICKLSGWNNSTDAFHQTASSLDGKGATLTMTQAIARAGILPSQISYVNAHGTGTENNDLSESTALLKVFGNRVPPFSSTKGFTGHALAAAGAIEAVFCVLAIQHQAVLPNINFSMPIPETGLVPETMFKPLPGMEHVLSNSFGFGGNCTTLIFSKTE